jgi:hypothetical protein
MRTKDDLYRLIKSLSKSEKRYFTLDAQKSGERNRNYFQLFQAINDMEEYDETALRTKFPNLSSDKAYLYEAILRSMRDYRSPKSKNAQIKERILDARFLYERGLYDQSEERLDSAKDLASEQHDALSLLEINKEERRLTKEGDFEKFRESIAELIGQKDSAFAGVAAEMEYLDIYDQLSNRVVEYFRLTTPERIQELKYEFRPEQWLEPSWAHAQHRYLQAMALVHHLQGDTEVANQYFRKTVDWWDSYPVIKKEEYFRYIIDLSNFMSVLLSTNQVQELEQLLSRLDQEKPENFHEEGLIFQKRCFYKLGLALKQDELDRGLQLLPEIEAGLKKFSIKEGTRMSIIHQVALILFRKHDFGQSLHWWRRLFEFKSTGIRRDIQKTSRLMHLVTLAELDDLEGVESALRSHQRFFKQNFSTQETTFENSFMNLFRNAIPLESSASLPALRQLCEFLESKTQSGADLRSIPNLEVLISWSKSKFSRKPLSNFR